MRQSGATFKDKSARRPRIWPPIESFWIMARHLQAIRQGATLQDGKQPFMAKQPTTKWLNWVLIVATVALGTLNIKRWRLDSAEVKQASDFPAERGSLWMQRTHVRHARPAAYGQTSGSSALPSSGWSKHAGWDHLPVKQAWDLTELADAYIVTLCAGGLSPDSIELALKGSTLCIQARNLANQGGALFRRSFMLPAPPHPHATPEGFFSNGVLRVMVRKGAMHERN